MIKGYQLKALETMIEHAKETYPHFESERGKVDIDAAISVIKELKQDYQGWTNYETWNVKLWLDNDEGSQELQRELLEQAQNTPKHEVWTREETTKFTLADLLKDYIDENNPLADDASMYSDLMNAAISEVNWNEIAEAIIDDNKEGN